MALSAFDDKARAPKPGELARVLGAASATWTELIARVRDQHGSIVEKWAFAGAKFGWSLRLMRKDRVVLYLTPQEGQFLAGVVLGEKAVERAKALRLSAAILTAFDEAPRYAEGRGVRLPVTKPTQVAALLKLIGAKLAG